MLLDLFFGNSWKVLCMHHGKLMFGAQSHSEPVSNVKQIMGYFHFISHVFSRLLSIGFARHRELFHTTGQCAFQVNGLDRIDEISIKMLSFGLSFSQPYLCVHVCLCLCHDK